ncbi:SphA family protein [Novosphingobium guangzhouense]|uniref:Phenol degradation protein meta n=1 Tax=Novosphingobium guangzhouense TaxID=1850347 RepID=A0A2K2FYZ3_9SPHN|nr:transporter [Novosphingobium guangzhouense]PNU04015.1 phenol degradation protein meta [Novosphingobium guangzhouense]
MEQRTHRTMLAAAVGAAALFALPGAAHATESGASLYLLGSGGPGTAVMAPVEGVYFDNVIWVYDGSASAQRSFPINGNIAAGLDTTIVADFPTMLFVPTTNALGGTLALGVTVPFGAPMIDVEALLTTPGGPSLSGRRHDSALTTGDPVAVGMLGWKADKLNIQLSTMVNVPVGNYREGALANLSLHRWAVDGSLALSWHDTDSGWDITAKAGHTWNGHNDTTGYDSGNEIHLEGSIEKAFSPKFSLGLQTYYQKQVTDDDGALGPFRGEVFAVGATAATTVTMAGVPATFRGRVFRELDTTNRLKGTSFWLDFSVPIHMNLPSN